MVYPAALIPARFSFKIPIICSSENLEEAIASYRILGMPRSGTTLVEQILASNPTVHGAGELLDLSQNISNYFGEVDDVKFADSVHQAGTEQFANAGSEYCPSSYKLEQSTA